MGDVFFLVNCNHLVFCPLFTIAIPTFLFIFMKYMLLLVYTLVLLYIFNNYTHEASESKCTSNPLTSLLSSKSHLFPAITNTIFGGPNLCSSAIHSCRTVNDCYHQTEIERLHRQLKYNWQGSTIQTTSYKKDKKKRWAV